MKLPAQRIKGNQLTWGAAAFNPFPPPIQGGFVLVALCSFLPRAPFVAGNEAVLLEAEACVYRVAHPRRVEDTGPVTLVTGLEEGGYRRVGAYPLPLASGMVATI